MMFLQWCRISTSSKVGRLEKGHKYVYGSVFKKGKFLEKTILDRKWIPTFITDSKSHRNNTIKRLISAWKDMLNI